MFFNSLVSLRLGGILTNKEKHFLSSCWSQKGLGFFREWINLKITSFNCLANKGHCCSTLLPIPRDFWQQDSREHLHIQRWAFIILHTHTYFIPLPTTSGLSVEVQFSGTTIGKCGKHVPYFMLPGTYLRPRLYIDKVEINLTAGIYYNIYT